MLYQLRLALARFIDPHPRSACPLADITLFILRDWCYCGDGDPRECPRHEDGEINGGDAVDWLTGQLLPRLEGLLWRRESRVTRA